MCARRRPEVAARLNEKNQSREQPSTSTRASSDAVAENTERRSTNQPAPMLYRPIAPNRTLEESQQNSSASSTSISGPFNDKRIRMILLGKTGAGKSSLGNLLLGLKHEEVNFKPGHTSQSQTKECYIGRATYDDEHYLSIVDTPGFYDTHAKTDAEKKALTKEITKSIQKSFPGPHVFLVTATPDKTTVLEVEALQKVGEIFGSAIWNYCVLVLTKANQIEDITVDEWVEAAAPEFKEILKKCGGRYVAVNSREKNDAERKLGRKNVLNAVIQLMQDNKNAPYTNKLFTKVNDVMKMNKEGVERYRDFDHHPVAEVVPDSEIIPAVYEVVEKHMATVFTD